MNKLIQEPYKDTDKLADDALEELNSLGLGYGAHTVIGMALGKLKAYESTGLTTEEIMDGKMLTGWIPVEEQLPGNSRAVLLCGADGWRKVGRYEHGYWWTWISHADIRDDVVAWMPLPEPYKSEEMTNQEVIEIIGKNYPKTTKMVDGRRKGGFDDTESSFGKALTMAIDALEKQVPMKPERCDMTTICPECGANWKRCYAYCPGCGQHIDWGTEP